MTRLALIACLALPPLTLAGCATVEGAGRDLSAAGNVVSDSARKVRRSF